jgi:hypothetical protein
MVPVEALSIMKNLAFRPGWLRTSKNHRITGLQSNDPNTGNGLDGANALNCSRGSSQVEHVRDQLAWKPGNVGEAGSRMGSGLSFSSITTGKFQ